MDTELAAWKSDLPGEDGTENIEMGTNSQVYRCNDLEVTQMLGFLKIIKLIPKCSKSAQSSKKPFTLNTYPKYLGG